MLSKRWSKLLRIQSADRTLQRPSVRYNVGELAIRSENAAKPMSQHARRARHMAYQEGSRRKGARLRLRQTPIHRISCCEEPSAHVGRFCSSNHQNATNRRQTDYRERVCTDNGHRRACFPSRVQEDPTKYDFILCANVLSAIPLANVRSMTLRRLAGALERRAGVYS